MMDQNQVLMIITLVVALSAAMLVWFAVDLATDTMKKYRAEFTEKAKFQTQEFFLFIDPKKLFVANVALMLLGAVLVWVLTGTAALAAPAFFVLGLFPRILYAGLRKRRLKKFESQLPDALMMISGGLRAGSSLSSATQQLVAEGQNPLAQEFSLMLREQRVGVTVEQSLNNLARRVPTQTTTLVVSAMRIANETGGGLAETLERTSNTIRSRLQMEGKIEALTAQGKLQAWVVGALPVMLMLVLNKMEPEAMDMIWHTPIGWATLVVLAFLEFMGVYLIRKITAIDV